MMLQAEQIIDVDRYPLGAVTEPEALAALTSWRGQFAGSGVCVLPGFIRPSVLPTLVREARQLAPLAFHNQLTGNAYLTPADPSLPADHPAHLTETTRLGAVAYDQIPVGTAIRTVYEWQPVRDFVAAIVDRGEVFPYACPLGALNIAVMEDGEYLRWHFDQADFVVSIPLQHPEQGGVFEYVHDIRSEQDENLDRVRALLTGSEDGVEVLDAPPGSLILFQGRHTIHRVTPIRGPVLRLGLLLGYALEPGLDSTDYLKQIRYGRTG